MASTSELEVLPGRDSFRQISAAPGGKAKTSRPRTREIRLDPGTTKDDDGRVIPLYRHMVEWLKMEKEIRDQNYPDCPYVFRRSNKPIKNFRKSWAKACAAAGVPNLTPMISGGRPRHGFLIGGFFFTPSAKPGAPPTGDPSPAF